MTTTDLQWGQSIKSWNTVKRKKKKKQDTQIEPTVWLSKRIPLVPWFQVQWNAMSKLLGQSAMGTHQRFQEVTCDHLVNDVTFPECTAPAQAASELLSSVKDMVRSLTTYAFQISLCCTLIITQTSPWPTVLLFEQQVGLLAKTSVNVET